MKKRMMMAVCLMAVLMIGTMEARAQVTFSKFKLERGMNKAFMTLWANFTATEKDVNRVVVDWCAVNKQGEAVDGVVSLGNATKTGVFYKKLSLRGPFPKGDKQKMYLLPAVIHHEKVTAVPMVVHLEYADGALQDIDVTRENIEEMFPCLKWVEYKRPDAPKKIVVVDAPDESAYNVFWRVMNGMKTDSVSMITSDARKAVLLTETVKVDTLAGDVSYVVVYAGKKKDDLYTFCRRWMAETFSDYNRVKQLEDREGGLLICNFTCSLFCNGVFNGSAVTNTGTHKWKVTVQVKDERLRVQMTEYEASWRTECGLGEIARHDNQRYTVCGILGKEAFTKDYTKKVNSVCHGLCDALEKYGMEEDF